MVVLDALDQVSPEHREVLVELYYRGRSVTEAAQGAGRSAGYREVEIVLRPPSAARRDDGPEPEAEVAR